MQIESLKMFCDVVRLRSFSLAAKENKVTQSTISQTVSQIEKHLGVTLIKRTQRPWKITQEGKVYYDGCRQIIEQYCELEVNVKNFNDRINAILRVACIYSVGLRHMSQYCKKFTEFYPRSQIHIEYLHPNVILERLLEDEIDLGIVSFPQTDRHLDVIPWHFEPMVIACYPGHALAKKKQVSIQEISGERFVGFDRGLVIRKEIDRFLRKHDTEVNVVMEFDNIEAIKRAVEAGSCISILPYPTLETEIKAKNLIAVPFIPKNFVRPLGIIHLRGKEFNTNMKRFIELINKPL